MTLRVIGAGYGRTGTQSLKRALERIGFDPCHHMEEVVRHPSEVPTWEAAARGEPVDWARFMARWQAAVDFPSALYYRELMATFPEAKVILTVRDPEAWWQSFSTTILPLMIRFPTRVVGPWLPVLGGPIRVTRHPSLAAVLSGGRESAIRGFVEHSAEVQRIVPPERLLVFEVKQGWEPLCRFLDVPIPAEPFPRVNDAKAFQRRTVFATALCWAVLLAPIVAVAAVVVAAVW